MSQCLDGKLGELLRCPQKHIKELTLNNIVNAMKSLKTSLRHRIQLQKKKLKRLQKQVTSAPTWADNLLEYITKNFRKSEVEAAKTLLGKTPVPVKSPHARGFYALKKAGIVVISEGFAVLARREKLKQVYSNGKTPKKGNLIDKNESKSSNASSGCPKRPKEEVPEDFIQQERD
tara:strand:+ start:297 stop:821 length:525 start_codon:yes stop_codon:yes gene_type:complete